MQERAFPDTQATVGPATTATINTAEGIAIDGAGNLFINDTGNFVIRKVTPANVISTYAGNGTQGTYVDGLPALSTSITSIGGIGVDAQSNLYVEDNLVRVVEISPSGSNIVTSIAGDGTGGVSGDGGPAILAQLAGPADVTVDPKGNVFIGDVAGNPNFNIILGGCGKSVARW